MARDMSQLDQAERRFLEVRHLATLTTIRGDGSPHVVAIAFTVDHDAGLVRIITSDGTQKVRNVERMSRVSVCQVDGASWLALEGSGRVARDPHTVAMAVAMHELRYRPVSDNPRRVAIEISVDRVLGAVRVPR